MQILISNIIIKERLRNLNTNKVKELAESIKEIGLLNPIIINQSNELIAGLHRLNAMVSLGYSEIECNVLSIEGLKQELAEIDENFIRNELDYLDRGKHLKRRKEIYESLYPETRKGIAGGIASGISRTNAESAIVQTESFVDNTSKILNISKRTIAEEIQIANAIPDTMVQTFKEQEVTKQEAVNIAQAITQEVKPLKQEIKIIEKQQEEIIKEIAKVEAKQEIEIVPKEVQIEALKQQEAENERKRIETEKEIQRQAEIKANEILKRIEAEKQAKKLESKQIRKEIIEKQIEDIESGKLPELKGLFDVVSVDPPWNYGREYDPDNSRVANPYPEMTVEQIKNIQLPLMENAIVFLWTTHRFLPEAFDILKTWGLDYKATIVWNKEKIGMGAWFRMQCEFCLMAIKGKPYWSNTTERDIIIEARREHSRKPDTFFNIVDKITAGRKLEYFSREKRNGWEIFGNDMEKF